MEAESPEQMQARHRRELKDLQGRITSKKKNATKRTRKGVNDECAEMERQLREKHASETAASPGNGGHEDQEQDAMAMATPITMPDDSTAPAAEAVEEGRDEVIAEAQEAEEARKAATQQDTSANGSAKDKSSPKPTTRGDEDTQTGRKRNRQKERLARRAAEQEAAAQRAHDEIASMTDHRAQEGEFLNKMFAAHQLEEREMEPNGHCLFSAVADQLAHNAIPLGGDDGAAEAPYKIVRRAAAAYMRENADDFAPFVDDDVDFESYLGRIRDTAEWGGQLELTALARRYGAEIRVLQQGRMERIGEDVGGVTGKTMWLAYYRHGYGLGEHYNSLRRKA